MAEVTVTSKGQITIPKEIREKMKLQAGDKIIFQTDAEGELKIKKSNVSIKDRAGSLRKYGRSKSVSIEEMDEAIKQRAVELDKKTK